MPPLSSPSVLQLLSDRALSPRTWP
jgi:hypothetical protein